MGENDLYVNKKIVNTINYKTPKVNKISQQIPQSLSQKERQQKMPSLFQSFCQYFVQSFNLDTTQQPIYLMTRDHTGSYIAMGMSIYNVYLLRQNILKNAIHLTKSNNLKIIRPASFVVGSFYFLGLYVLWNVPCFFTQIAVRVYCATQTATTNVLLKQYISNSILNEQRIVGVMKRQGINV